ncbi:Homocysteine S-methyltransferase [Harpegnathos saltator]|uniref:Homocysteine S-methyltransferase n=1 Tax=Harpegnathos saltator TaxID=610380 RepID=E2C782_HARSA|nr:Homocysteine S-methyltransferase [Harpegnathos saltator]
MMDARKEIKTIDGDFVAQLCCNLKKQANFEAVDPLVDIRIIQTNRYAIYRVHLDFLHAGATIIRTNTARISEAALSKINSNKSVRYFIKNAVLLARKAVCKYYKETRGDMQSPEIYDRNRPQIAGYCTNFLKSCFRKGLPFDYWNEVSREEMLKLHRLRIRELLKAGVDMLAIEDIHNMVELKIIVEVLRRYKSAKVWISFTCLNDVELFDGSLLLDAIKHCRRSLHSGQIIAIGAKCWMDGKELSLLKDIYNATRKDRIPLIAYINEEVLKFYQPDIMYYVKEAVKYGAKYFSGDNGGNLNEIKMISSLAHTYNIIHFTYFPDLSTSSSSSSSSSDSS